MTAVNGASGSPGLNLVRFDSATPGTVVTIGAFSGLTAGQAVRAIDFRPANGELFALAHNTTTGAAQIYKVSLTTASLIPVGAIFTVGTGTRLSMNFNPIADRIRVVQGLGTPNNFRVNPNDGTLITDTSLAFDAGDAQAGNTSATICSIAYTNNYLGATSTTLYAWDYASDGLLTIGGIGGVPSPNSGIMRTVSLPPALLGYNAGIGFDISGATGVAYTAHDVSPGTVSNLYTRNLATGVEILIGAFPAGTFITDISVQVSFNPGACCNPRNGTCTLIVASACRTLGLTAGAADSTCAALPCHACPADFNLSGGLEVQDIFDFLNAWLAGCP
jgi:hypothetical protein